MTWADRNGKRRSVVTVRDEDGSILYSGPLPYQAGGASCGLSIALMVLAIALLVVLGHGG